MHPQLLGLTLAPKLTYNTHIHNILVQAHKPLQMIKTLAATGSIVSRSIQSKHTYKAVMTTGTGVCHIHMDALLHPQPAL